MFFHSCRHKRREKTRWAEWISMNLPSVWMCKNVHLATSACFSHHMLEFRDKQDEFFWKDFICLWETWPRERTGIHWFIPHWLGQVQAWSCKSETQSRSPTWVVAAQLLELSPAASHIAVSRQLKFGMEPWLKSRYCNME